MHSKATGAQARSKLARAPTRLGVLALLLTLGLDPACKEEPPQLAIPDGYSEQLGRAFEAAAAQLELRKNAAPGEPVRWQVPGCELEYRFRVVTQIGTTGGVQEHVLLGMWKEGSWTASDKAGVMGLDLRIHHGKVRDGVYERSSFPQEHTWPRLKSDGRAWTEVGSTSEQWSSTGQWSGINEFFPVLLDLSEPGSQITVSLPLRGAAKHIVAALDAPKPDALSIPTRMELHDWIEVSGQRAAVVRARYAYSGSSELFGREPIGGCGFVDEIELVGEGQFVVLESGILLHAEVREQIEHYAGFILTPASVVLSNQSEARLVGGCGQPQLPDFPELPGITP